MRAPTPPLLPCVARDARGGVIRVKVYNEIIGLCKSHLTTYTNAHNTDADRVDLHVLDVGREIAAHVHAKQDADQVFANNLRGERYTRDGSA